MNTGKCFLINWVHFIIKMDQALLGIDSTVAFSNSQNVKGRGTLVHITRKIVVFEVYNPYSLVQVSEALSNIKVMRGDRLVYDGTGTVTYIVTTGLMSIVTVALSDVWADLNGLMPGAGLKIEAERFIKDWEVSHSLRSSYQLIVNDIAGFLGELSRWLEEAESGVFLDEHGTVIESLKHEFYEEIKNAVAPKIFSIFDDFEDEASQVPEEEADVHKAFVRRELHPLILCSPFIHRAYTKPLGYAGDYEMVNMMLYESKISSLSIYANLIHDLYLQKAPAKAHRNRIVILEDMLKEKAKDALQKNSILKVLNVGCGPAVEVQRFVRTNSLCNHVDFELLDFNKETIDYAFSSIQTASLVSGNKPSVKMIHKSIHALLRESAGKTKVDSVEYDFVYCAGLFDYLTQLVCKKLVELFNRWVRPGGSLLVSNVHSSNPDKFGMEHLVEWHLIYRDEVQIRDLVPNEPGISFKIFMDPTGVNIFLLIEKEENG